MRRALNELEVIVAYDMLPSATAEMAHLVLPAASDFERHAYGAWPALEGDDVAWQQKVIEPVGERNVFEVEYALAKGWCGSTPAMHGSGRSRARTRRPFHRPKAGCRRPHGSRTKPASGR